MAHPAVAQVRRPLAALLVADVISTTGSEMTGVALPWLVLTTTGSPARTGAVLAADFVGMTIFGLFGGRAAGVLGPRRFLLGADIVRAILVGAVPVLYAIHLLSFPVLLVAMAAVGAFFPGYGSSQQVVAAALVGDDEVRLTRFTGVQGAFNETASFIGPGLGGAMVALLGAANVLAVDSVSYLAAFALVLLLVPAPVPSTVDEKAGSIRAGLRHVLRQRSLRRQLIGVGIVEIAWTAMMATLPVLALQAGAGARGAGLLVGAYGLGSVIGGLISSRARRVDGRVGIYAVAGVAAAAWLLALIHPLWMVGIAVGFIGVCSGLFFPRFFAAVTTRTPPNLRPTVMTAVMVAISAPGPIGFLAAGVVSEASGTRLSLLLVALAATVGAAVVAWAGALTPRSTSDTDGPATEPLPGAEVAPPA